MNFINIYAVSLAEGHLSGRHNANVTIDTKPVFQYKEVCVYKICKKQYIYVYKNIIIGERCGKNSEQYINEFFDKTSHRHKRVTEIMTKYGIKFDQKEYKGLIK